MEAQIQSLIDKVDSVEIVRDQIAGILLVESANQQLLATAAQRDSRSWALRVFTEASNPWEQFREAPDPKKAQEPADFTPIVNVMFDQVATDRATSSQVNRKWVEGTFQIDCYGYGISAASGDGQASGDTSASLEAQRAARLVRNILESAHYCSLGLVKLVGDRRIQTIQSFQPTQGGQQTQHVQAVRLTLNCNFSEYSPQYEGAPFEAATMTLTRIPTGEVVITEQFEFDASSG